VAVWMIIRAIQVCDFCDYCDSRRNRRNRNPDVAPRRLLIKVDGAEQCLKALSQGDARFDHAGSPAGEVTTEQRELASSTFRERFKMMTERHKAEVLAMQLAEKQSKLEKDRQDKLLKLAEKFNTR